MKDAKEPQPDRAPMVRPATARSSPCEEYAFAREFFPQARRPAADRPAHFGSKAATRLFLLGRTPSHRPACGEGEPAPLALAFRECPTSIAVPTGCIGVEPWPHSLGLLVWRGQHGRLPARFDKNGFANFPPKVRIFGPAPLRLVPTPAGGATPPDGQRWRVSPRRVAVPPGRTRTRR